MTAREWKPGDLIVDEGGTVFFVVPTYPSDSGRPNRGIDADGNDWYLKAIEGPLRPLVVIDSENGLHVERLVTLFWERQSGDRRYDEDAMQAALREFANPTPKPEEPTDPAARVFAAGTFWAKVGPWWVSPDIGQSPREWDYLVECDDFEVPA